ncbi:TPA: ANR family transcriptional regulator [Serratia marcescens]|nr:ANR family transcriptional regulator [Serratia marcescens]HCR2979764.1 ANR family transcriptional regulator [Serratia marcescens]
MQEMEKIGGPDVGALPGMSIMSTTRERLRATQRRAAELEREARFDDAALYWLAGQALAMMESERLWCEARAELCLKRGRADVPDDGTY